MGLDPPNVTTSADRLATRNVSSALAVSIAADEPMNQRRVCGSHLLRMNVQPEFGGAPATCVKIVDTMIGYGLGGINSGILFSLAAQMWAVQYPLGKYGRYGVQKTHLPGLCSGNEYGAHAMSESGAGSDPLAMSAVASRVRDGWVLNGEKCWVTNAKRAGLILAFARTGAPGTPKAFGVSCFAVSRISENARVTVVEENLVGMDGVSLGNVEFLDCFIDEDAVVGPIGSGLRIFSDIMERERLFILAGVVGIAMRRLRDSVVRNGHRMEVARLVSRLSIAEILLAQSAAKLDTGSPAPLSPSGVKVLLSELFVDLMSSVLSTPADICDEVLLSEYFHAHASKIYSGSTELQMDALGRELGLR